MLKDHPAYATIPTADVDRLRPFYEDTLGFSPERITAAGVYYAAADGTLFAVTRSGGKASGSHTQLAFRVSGIDAEVADLRTRGVEFEEYDEGPFRTVDGIATLPIGRAAWFKDPDGNTIGLLQLDD